MSETNGNPNRLTPALKVSRQSTSSFIYEGILGGAPTTKRRQPSKQRYQPKGRGHHLPPIAATTATSIASIQSHSDKLV
ncbi:hypothetical protein QJS04_geneDACA010429 [Acorus gramineus]|uniref:Uncharacterized protein n=1 Tax=Acorus gramineus TaxID=55184 RepID=A0AAV9A2E4_ACOGR|nr:hypothetical protein QJS04_geneDACA010429 [Acorus gramineus]